MPDRMIGAKIFRALLYLLYFVLYVILRAHLLPEHSKHYGGPLSVVWCVALLIIFWSWGIFDRR